MIEFGQCEYTQWRRRGTFTKSKATSKWWRYRRPHRHRHPALKLRRPEAAVGRRRRPRPQADSTLATRRWRPVPETISSLSSYRGRRNGRLPAAKDYPPGRIRPLPSLGRMAMTLIAWRRPIRPQRPISSPNPLFRPVRIEKPRKVFNLRNKKIGLIVKLVEYCTLERPNRRMVHFPEGTSKRVSIFQFIVYVFYEKGRIIIIIDRLHKMSTIEMSKKSLTRELVKQSLSILIGWPFYSILFYSFVFYFLWPDV